MTSPGRYSLKFPHCHQTEQGQCIHKTQQAGAFAQTKGHNRKTRAAFTWRDEKHSALSKTEFAVSWAHTVTKPYTKMACSVGLFNRDTVWKEKASSSFMENRWYSKRLNNLHTLHHLARTVTLNIIIIFYNWGAVDIRLSRLDYQHYQ